MTGREHVAIGVGYTALLIGAIQTAGNGLDLHAMWPALLAAAAGSLAPDMDHPNSLASLSIPAALIGYAGVFLVYRRYEAGNPSAISLGVSALGPEWVLAAWVALAVGFTLLLVSFVLGAMFGHRGAVHSIAFGLATTGIVLIGLAVFKAPPWLAVPFAWGWISHLFADATTSAGLSDVFWPLRDRV
jgi:membrane-bound metal-dependent hydrolase YbcI (DUF457 family)